MSCAPWGNKLQAVTEIGGWTAVVPARSGSKGLPGKNIRILDGKPLFMHAVDNALNAGAEKVLITTDIKDVLDMDFPSRVEVVRREQSLSDDKVPMQAVLLSLKKYIEHDTFVLLQPTSPFRNSVHIKEALELYFRRDFKMVMSAAATERSVLKYGIALEDGTFQPINNPDFCFENRQKLPAVFKPNGALYIIDYADFYINQKFNTEKIGLYEMGEKESLDIDCLDDFLLAERIFKELKK